MMPTVPVLVLGMPARKAGVVSCVIRRGTDEALMPLLRSAARQSREQSECVSGIRLALHERERSC